MVVVLAAGNRYLAAADLIEKLPKLSADARANAGVTAKVQAKQIGITLATLTRLEAGSVPTQKTVLAVLRWLGRPAEEPTA